MHWAGPGFVLALIGLSMGAWIVTTWIRAKHGYPVENEWGGMSSPSSPATDRKIELLSTENERLKGQIGRLEERIAVLERIVTDKPARLADEIEKLR